MGSVNERSGCGRCERPAPCLAEYIDPGHVRETLDTVLAMQDALFRRRDPARRPDDEDEEVLLA